MDIWGVARGTGFSCQEHVHITGYGDLELVGLGAGFSLGQLETERAGLEAKASAGGAMDAESTGGVSKKKRGNKLVVSRRRGELVLFRSAEGVEEFHMKVQNYQTGSGVGTGETWGAGFGQSDGMAQERPGGLGAIKADGGEMDTLIRQLQGMGIGKDAPREATEMEGDIEDDREEDGSLEDYEQNLQTIP